MPNSTSNHSNQLHPINLQWYVVLTPGGSGMGTKTNDGCDVGGISPLLFLKIVSVFQLNKEKY
jgi:hypothetical protein